jgi:hypothetical protein
MSKRNRRPTEACRGLRLDINDLVADIDAIEAFVLGVHVKVQPLGIDDGGDDGGVAFAGEDPASDIICSVLKTALTHQSFIANRSKPVGRSAFLPDLDSLIQDNLFVGFGDGWIGCGDGGCGGQPTRWVGILGEEGAGEKGES